MQFVDPNITLKCSALREGATSEITLEELGIVPGPKCKLSTPLIVTNIDYETKTVTFDSMP